MSQPTSARRSGWPTRRARRPASQRQLAERFGISRRQVGKALAATSALTAAAVAAFADKGHRGARGAVGAPFYGRDLPDRMRECNAAHAKVRAVGERAIAALKTWKLVSKLRCCPQRATALSRAILVLQHLEDARR